MESKKEIYDIIPAKWYPKTLFIAKGSNEDNWKVALQEAAFLFPIIGKPDIGMRGLAVQKLNSIEDVSTYAKESKVDFLLQEFVSYENEVGIFYYRYPNQEKGNITGIVGKEFLSVLGDGVSTVEELINLNSRAILQLKTLRKVFRTELKRKLPLHEKFLLVPYGNHSRGAKFIDVSDLIDDQLTQSFDTICQQIPGFYFGRLDIRFKSWEDLRLGKNFSIIELNGAGSEPTHMYDPKHSIFYAWKEITRHLQILYKVSMLNHRNHGAPFLPFDEGWQMFKENKAYVKMIQPVERSQ